jgi:hypothetical protein
MPRRAPSPLSSAVTAVLTLLPGLGCEGSLPSEPEVLTEGIVVYVDDHYKGESGLITRDISDLNLYDGPCENDDLFSDEPMLTWGDCISSVRVAPGWRATLYRDSDYDSDSLVITSNVPDLERVYGHCLKGGLGDCVSSIRVSRIQ